MSLIWYDGFEGYYDDGSTPVHQIVSGGLVQSGFWFADTIIPYLGSQFIPHRSGKALKLGTGANNGNSYLANSVIVDYQNFTIGCGYFNRNYPDAGFPIWVGTFVSQVGGFRVWVDAQATWFRIGYKDDADQQIFLDTTAPNPLNEWHYIEFQIDTSGANPVVKFRYDGVEHFNQTIIGIKSDFANVRFFGFHGESYDYQYFDDVYVADDLTFRGPFIIESVPLAQGAQDMYTPNGAATVLECIDDGNTTDLDTTYASSTAANDVQSFTATFTDTVIQAVLLRPWHRAYGTSSWGVQTAAGGETKSWSHTDQYLCPEQVILDMPGTGDPLTAAALNALSYSFSHVQVT